MIFTVIQANSHIKLKINEHVINFLNKSSTLIVFFKE